MAMTIICRWVGGWGVWGLVGLGWGWGLGLGFERQGLEEGMCSARA